MKEDIEKKIVDGHLAYKEEDKDNAFDCSFLELTSLLNCPDRVDCYFNCSSNNLTTLKDGPKYVGREINCRYNKLTSLKGCPEYVGDTVDCGYNTDLTDISDLPVTVKKVGLTQCDNVTVFTKEIDNGNEELIFWFPTMKVAERIKQWPYYDVVKESNDFIIVKIKDDNEVYMNDL